MSNDAHERFISDETDVEESAEIARKAVDWAFDSEQLKTMTPEQRLDYDIELAEKIRRQYEAQQELALILTAAGIVHEGETPRVIIDRTLNPDKEEYQKSPEAQ